MRRNKQKLTAFKLIVFGFIMLTNNLLAQNAVTYTLSADDVTIEDSVIVACSYNFAANTDGTNLIIPDDLGVKGIVDAETDWMGDVTGNDPFVNKNITGISLPGSIVHIGDHAFSKNNITELSLPNTVEKIGRDAFFENNIDTLIVPSSVITIGANAFHSNTLLDTVIIEDNSKLIYIGSHAFVYTKVRNIKLPTPVVPDNNFEYWIEVQSNQIKHEGGAIVNVDSYKFVAKFDYTLTDADLTVENGIITGCSYDFSGKFIIIPSEIGGQTITGVADATGQKSAVFYGKGMWALTLPETIKTIGDYSFNSNSIDTLVIPSSLESIGMAAFWGFSLDTVLYEPNCKLTSIGMMAFDNNKNLKMVFPTPIKDGFNFDRWEDDDNSANTFNGGDEIIDFKPAYTAHFDLPAGTPVIDLVGELLFGDRTNTTTGVEYLTIKNLGNSTLTISSIQLPDACFSVNWEGGDIGAGEEKDISFDFVPTESRSYSGIVRFVSNAAFGLDSMIISGNGINEILQSITNLNDINVSNTTEESAIVFPSELSIATNGATSTLDISNLNWESEDYNGEIADTYIFKTTIAAKLTEANIEKGEVSDTIYVNVVVAKEMLNSIANVNDINVDNGTEVVDIVFPAEIEIVTDVKTFNMDISNAVWESADYNKDAAGIYSFSTDLELLLIEKSIDAGEESTILKVNVVVADPLSINNGLEQSVKIYPNPAKGFINVDFEGNAAVTFSDASGKVILAKEASESLKINIEEYKSGLYFIKLTGKYETIVKSFIKE